MITLICNICTGGMIQVQKEGYCTAFKSFGSPQTLVKTPHIWVFLSLRVWNQRQRIRLSYNRMLKKNTGTSARNRGQALRQAIWKCPCDTLQLYIHPAGLSQFWFSSAVSLGSFHSGSVTQISFKCELWSKTENSFHLALQIPNLKWDPESQKGYSLFEKYDKN